MGITYFVFQKKDGMMDMHIDFKKLNKVAIKNNYPPPQIDDLFNQLAGSYIFMIDLYSRYYQVKMIEKYDLFY